MILTCKKLKSGGSVNKAHFSVKLTGTSFLKLVVGLVMVVVLAAVVVVVVVVTRVLGCPGCGALGPPGCCDWAWAWTCASAKLPGVVMEPCIFTGGSRDCWPYSIYCTHRIFKRTERGI